MAYLTSTLRTLQLAAHAITMSSAGFTDCTLLITSLYYEQISSHPRSSAYRWVVFFCVNFCVRYIFHSFKLDNKIVGLQKYQVNRNCLRYCDLGQPNCCTTVYWWGAICATPTLRVLRDAILSYLNPLALEMDI